MKNCMFKQRHEYGLKNKNKEKSTEDMKTQGTVLLEETPK